MPIAVPKTMKCKKCKKKFSVLIGDVRPQKIECPNCKNYWLYFNDSHIVRFQ